MHKISCSLLVITLLVSSGCYSKTRQEGSSTMTTKKQNPSGLRYEIIKEGSADAKQAIKGSTVSVHYTGWLNDGKDTPGTMFDSSLSRGTPFQFKLGVGYVIKGWDEGVAGMKVGEKRRLYIPSALGYGSYGAGTIIPPHADLIFDVELLSC